MGLAKLPSQDAGKQSRAVKKALKGGELCDHVEKMRLQAVRVRESGIITAARFKNEQAIC